MKFVVGNTIATMKWRRFYLGHSVRRETRLKPINASVIVLLLLHLSPDLHEFQPWGQGVPLFQREFCNPCERSLSAMELTVHVMVNGVTRSPAKTHP